MLPIMAGQLQRLVQGARPAAAPETRPGKEEDEDDEEDEAQDMPTTALQAMDWEAPAPAPAQPARPAEPAAADVAGKRPPPAVVVAPQTLPAPAPLPPPVAGLEEQSLVGSLLRGDEGAPRQSVPAAPARPAQGPPLPPPPAPAPPPAGPAAASPLRMPPPPAPISVPPPPEKQPPAPRRPAFQSTAAEPLTPLSAILPPLPTKRKSGGGKLVLPVLLVLLGLGGAAACGAYFFLVMRQVKVTFETEVIHLREEGKFQVNLKLRQVSGPDKQLLLAFRGERQEFRSEGSFTFSVPEEELSVGSNQLNAVVLSAEEVAAPLTSIPVELFLNYRYSAPVTEVKLNQKQLTFTITIPAGSTLEMENATLTGDGDERTVTVDLEKTVGPFHKQMKRNHPLELKTTLALADGRSYKDSFTIVLDLPQADLKVLLPAQLVTAREQLEVRGMIAPEDEAVVTINGKEPENMYNDGEFEWKQVLKPGKQEITIVASHPGRVAHQAALEVTRLTRAELKGRRGGIAEEAEIWAKDAINPGPKDLLDGAEAALKGKKIKLEGHVLQLMLSGERLEQTLIVLSTCGGGGCPVLVQIEGAVDVLSGERATVYGVISGKGKYRARAAGQEEEVPMVQSEYVVGS
ncbi:MAG: hypothetical protein FJ125_14115 [Deltaproteobacteria bacterium]|nr:hypothetical protein [Deltaproteobacteria bacterium]